MQPKRRFARYWTKGDSTMMIFMLAAAMTLAMLIATAFALHNEAQHVKLEARRRDTRRYRMG
jgi:hypothetical protein